MLASMLADAAAVAFPPSLDSYPASPDAPLRAVLAGRILAEPLNLVASIVFLLALLHTFLAPHFLAHAHRLQEAARARAEDDPDDGGHSVGAVVFHFLGEVEAVFGIWAVPLLAIIAAARGWPVAEAFLGHGVNFTEPIFVVVIMAIAATRPVMHLAESWLGAIAAVGRCSPLAWWLSVLTLGPLLGSFITEPAAMVISAILLGRHVYDRAPSARLRYATLGLLFVNISVGGTLTHFAAPPVLMVAARWGWDTPFMLQHYGGPSLLGIALSNLLYALFFWKEFRELAARPVEPAVPARPLPAWITGVHLAFLAWTVLAAHTPALVVAGLLFLLAFAEATAPHQTPINLRPPLLVGFFLAGLVVHGTLQQWWIEPVLSRLQPFPLIVGATLLTAVNDNAAITYLASLVPGFSEAMKQAVVAGAVVGGGLTVIANAPNPAGQSALARYFRDGVAPGGLLLGAVPPTLIQFLAHWYL
jgi:hypothetical protein